MMRHTVSVLQTGVVGLSIEHDKLEGDKLSVQLLAVLYIDRSGWATTRRYCRSCKTRERVVGKDFSPWLFLLKLHVMSWLKFFLGIKFWP